MAGEPLKVGLVLDTSLDPMDGVQQYVIAVGEWLRSQGHDVHYLVGETSQRELPGIHSLTKNIAVRFNGNRTTMPLPASRRKLRKFLRDENFDVLHIQIPHSPFMAQPLIVQASPETAIIGTFHIAPYNNLVRIGNRLLGIWLRKSLRRFDRIVSVSPAAQHFAKQTFKVESVILPNVIDYSLFNSAKPLAEYADGKLTILFLGRLVPRKGCKLLLEAVAKLSNDSNLPPFRVIICGKGPLMPKLQKFAKDKKIDKLVEFVGYVSDEDKRRYYASAGISVFPSSGGESFGIVLIEAMASGHAAVVAGNNIGYRSVMQPKQELLFDPKNAKELAQKLSLYMKDDFKRKQLAKWGENYAKRFDTPTVGAELVKIYRQALHKRRTQ